MKNVFFGGLLFATLLFAGTELCAKTVNMGYKVGFVTAAEISSVPTEIINRENSPYNFKFAKPIFAVVVLKMEPSRSINPVDYSLVLGRTTVNCIAAALDMAPFVASPVTLSPGSSNYVRLLFVFNGAQTKVPALNKTMRVTLKSNIPGRSSLTFNITGLGNGKFTDVTKIPAAGLIK